MMRVATTLLAPEEMGRVSLVLTSTAFFALFLVNPVGMFINRRLHAWQAGGVARHYLIRYAGYLLLVALLAGVILPLLHISKLVSFGISIAWLIALVCGSLFFNTINQTAIPSLNLLGYSGRFVLLSLLTIAVGFASAAALVTMIRPSAEYWLLGLLFGQALVGLVGIQIFFTRLERRASTAAPPAIRRSQLRMLFGFAWPVAIAAGLSWIQGQGYRYLIEGQLGLAQLGLFVAGYGISAGMIAGFESVLTTYFQPRLYRDVSAAHPLRQAQAWRVYASAVIPSLLLTVALIVSLSPELTRLFLGKNFQSAADYLVWGALAEAARVLMGIYSLIAHVRMRTRWLILPNVVGAALSIALCAWLIPRFGAAGAGAGLALSGFAVVALMHLLLAPQVGGGAPVRPILRASVLAMAIWGGAFGLRHLLDTTVSGGIAGILALIGLIYLGLQYLFLREHMIEKREA